MQASTGKMTSLKKETYLGQNREREGATGKGVRCTKIQEGNERVGKLAELTQAPRGYIYIGGIGSRVLREKHGREVKVLMAKVSQWQRSVDLLSTVPRNLPGGRVARST